MNEQTYSDQPVGGSPPPTVRRPLARGLGVVAGTGILIGAVVVALGGAASAGEPVLVDQDDAIASNYEAEYLNEGGYGDDADIGEPGFSDGDVEVYVADELSEADAAVFEAYDQCLVDAGVPVFETLVDEGVEGVEAFELTEEDLADLDELYDGHVIELEELDEDYAVELEDGWVESEWSDSDWEAFDAEHGAAFETCDPILEGLGDEWFIADGIEGELVEWFMADGIEGELVELSVEDEAVLERYDECLIEFGVPMDDVEVSEDDLEAAFVECDPILEDLSEDGFGDVVVIEDIEGFEAAVEEFDQCLADAGIDLYQSADAESLAVTDDDIESIESFTVTDDDIEAIESCEIIFENLEDEILESEILGGDEHSGEVEVDEDE